MEDSIPEQNFPLLSLAVFQGNAGNSPNILSTKRNPIFVTNLWNGFSVASFLNMMGSNGSSHFWENTTMQKINKQTTKALCNLLINRIEIFKILDLNSTHYTREYMTPIKQLYEKRIIGETKRILGN